MGNMQQQTVPTEAGASNEIGTNTCQILITSLPSHRSKRAPSFPQLAASPVVSWLMMS